VWAQHARVTLSGSVLDASNGESMMGVYVVLSDLKTPSNVQGCASNQAGYYSISVLPGNYKLTVNYLGYKTIEDTISLTRNTQRLVEMEPAAITGSEVVIQGERGNVNVTSGEVGRMELSIQTIKALPALMGEADVIKSVQLLPGVQSGGEGNSGFYVRGSGTDQNLVLLDEATIYNPDHLFGFFSIFNADAVKSVDLIKSGMPAYYGGRAASILSVYQKEGNMKKYEVDGGLGLIFSHLTVQGPIKKNRASFLISARRTYADVIVQPFLKKDNPMKGTNFYFYDLNAKFNIVINPRHRLYFGAYYGQDVYGFKSVTQQTKMSFKWGNAAASARWNYIIANRLFLNTTATFSYYSFTTGMLVSPYSFALASSVRDYGLKSELTWIPTPKHNLRFGVHNVFHDCLPGHFDVEAGEGVAFNIPTTQHYLGNELSIYIHDEWDISRHWKLNMGVRYTNYHHLGPFKRYVTDEFGQLTDSILYPAGKSIAQYNRAEPRLALRWLIDSTTSIKASATLNYQFMHQISIATISLPTDVWMPSTDLMKPQTVFQYSLGVFKNFHQNMFESYIDLYYKQMYNLPEYREGIGLSMLHLNTDQLYVFGKGWAAGAEFFVKKSRGRFTGFIGYTLAFTRRQFDDLNGGKPFWAKYDRRHDVTISLSYEILPNKLRASALWVYQSGNTMTVPLGYYLYMGSVVTEFSDRNEYRVNPYHRLDISVDWTIKKTAKFETGLNFSIYNVYNRQNPFLVFFETTVTTDDGDLSSFSMQNHAYQMSLFPIIPSVMWTFKF
jgi:hypothetical protein